MGCVPGVVPSITAETILDVSKMISNRVIDRINWLSSPTFLLAVDNTFAAYHDTGLGRRPEVDVALGLRAGSQSFPTLQ